MTIKLEPIYTEFDAARILTDSEDEAVSAADRAKGHAERYHELISAGRGRASVSHSQLVDRIAFNERINRVSAFSGCQAKAVTYALNRKGGQTALNWLCYPNAISVFAFIDISTERFSDGRIFDRIYRAAGFGRPLRRHSDRQDPTRYARAAVDDSPVHRDEADEADDLW